MGDKFHPIETVGVGDLVSVTWKDGDVARTARSRVAEVRAFGRVRVFVSDQGIEFARYDLGKLSQVWCVVHERHVPVQPDLFGVFTSEQFRERIAS